MFTEVRCNFFDEGIWYIDAWLTDDNDEEGFVVATINEKTFEVHYINDMYKTNNMVLDAVKEKLRELVK